MKKLLVIISVAALVAGCRTHRNESTGGMGTENTGATYGTSPGGTTGGTGAAGPSSGTSGGTIYNSSTNLNNPGTGGTSTPQQ